MYANMKKIYENTNPVMYNMAVAYLLDKGFSMVLKITDEQIEELEGNSMMTEDFVKGIVKTAREIAIECDNNVVELIQFCQKKRVFDTKYYN